MYSDLRASINGKDVPEDVKARLLKLHEENIVLKEQLSTSQSKLTKAKAVSRFRLDHLFLHTKPFGTFSSSSSKTSSSEQTSLVQMPAHL